MLLNIHESIKQKLEYFKSIHKIPNIIFHGPSGSGKRTIVNDFINDIYNYDREKIKSLVMSVNCAHGKGIKFIREELKFFAKTHINSNGGDIFKSIILLNADKLTMDAQSALRRCIELFSHNTRFFIVVEDKYNLLKPILSRFCEIYVPEPMINGEIVNLYVYNMEKIFNTNDIKKKKIESLKKELIKIKNSKLDIETLMLFCEKIYEKGYNALDILNLLQKKNFLESKIPLIHSSTF
jgi:DNA polymerase III delta prime subunit